MAMGEWQQLVQSVFLGLVFSFLLAKLISVVISFRDENLSLSREKNVSPVFPEPPQSSNIEHESNVGDFSGCNEMSSRVSEDDSMIAEKGSVRSESLLGEDGDEDDDWEGVESTELDETFSAATAFVVAAAADRLSQKASNDAQLQLYGLYKIATEGPCSTPQPSALKMAARAKWQAWQKLGAMPPEDAMQKYIDIVTELYPNWIAGAAKETRPGSSDVPGADSRATMGPVFSTFMHEEESGSDLKMDAIHVFAREGEAENLVKCIEGGVSVNYTDSEGRTPLHWAVDRGHLNIVELLVGKGADSNAKDKEGQTPLHYAVVCEREAVAEFLVKQHGDIELKDNNGESPRDLCVSNWPWMRVPAKEIE